MKLHDLGEIGGPVLVFGGPYSNLQATRALLDRSREAGFGPERMICTGAIVTDCAQPAETIADIRAAGLIQGHHGAPESGYWPSEEVLPPRLRRAARASG